MSYLNLMTEKRSYHTRSCVEKQGQPPSYAFMLRKRKLNKRQNQVSPMKNERRIIELKLEAAIKEKRAKRKREI